MNPQISVLLSTKSRNYGDKYCKNLLRRALDSVVNQTFKDFELIIVDDNSTDGTATILEEYKLRDPRIKIFRFDADCGGLTALRYNFAAKQGSGNWFAYIFDDDVWELNHLETLFAAATPQVAMIYGLAKVIRTEQPHLPHLVMGHQWNANILRYNYIPNLSVLLNRDTYIKLGGSDENPKMRRYSDWEYWRRIWKAQLPVTFVPRILATVYEGKPDGLRRTVESVEFSEYSLVEQMIPDMSSLRRTE